MSSFKDCRPTISRSPRVPCGNRTRLAGLEDRRLRRSAKGTRSGRRESRTLKAHRSAVFGTAAVAHRLALPFQAAVAGIEPALVSLTGSRLTIGLHRKANKKGQVSVTPGLCLIPSSRGHKRGRRPGRRANCCSEALTGPEKQPRRFMMTSLVISSNF